MRMVVVAEAHNLEHLCERHSVWHKYCQPWITSAPWPNPQGSQTTQSCRREKIKAKVFNISLMMAEGLGNTSLIKPFGRLCFDFYLDSLSTYPWWPCEWAASKQRRSPHHTQWALRNFGPMCYSTLPRPSIPLSEHQVRHMPDVEVQSL